MKIDVIDAVDDKGVVYPRLMSMNDTSMVALFFSAECGTVIVSGDSGWGGGEYYDGWDITGFSEFKGQIVMEND